MKFIGLMFLASMAFAQESSEDWDYFGLKFAPPEVTTEYIIEGSVEAVWHIEAWWYVVVYTDVEINGYFTKAPVLFTTQTRPSMIRRAGQRVTVRASYQGMHSQTGLPWFFVLEVMV